MHSYSYLLHGHRNGWHPVPVKTACLGCGYNVNPNDPTGMYFVKDTPYCMKSCFDALAQDLRDFGAIPRT